jgi:hypothetical protein
MKVVCSLYQLLRLVFLSAMVALIIGASLGHPGGTPAPRSQVVPVVSGHGGEVR